MTFNNPFVHLTNPPLLSFYQQSHDLKQEAYGHGGDADVRVRALCVVFICVRKKVGCVSKGLSELS